MRGMFRPSSRAPMRRGSKGRSRRRQRGRAINRALFLSPVLVCLLGVGWSYGGDRVVASALKDPLSILSLRSPGERQGGKLSLTKPQRSVRIDFKPTERVLGRPRTRPGGSPGAAILPNEASPVIYPAELGEPFVLSEALPGVVTGVPGMPSDGPFSLGPSIPGGGFVAPPGAPSGPGEPAEPQLPVTPTTPGGPDSPDVPTPPDDPGQPGLPIIPIPPGTPLEPGTPDVPGMPQEPGLPNVPGNPNVPNPPGPNPPGPNPPGPNPPGPDLPGPDLPGPNPPGTPGEPTVPGNPNVPGAVPEPATWLMSIIGMFAVAAGMRRKAALALQRPGPIAA